MPQDTLPDQQDEPERLSLKNLSSQPWLRQFRDVRAIGLVIFLVIALMVSWSGVKVIQTNYELQRQISQLQQENQVSQLANNNIKLENQYFNTNQYLELKARQDFGLGAPGEKLIIVPKEVALSYATDQTAGTKVPTPSSKQPQYQKNFEAWVSFFLHRQQSL